MGIADTLFVFLSVNDADEVDTSRKCFYRLFLPLYLCSIL